MGKYFSKDYPDGPFQLFSTPHIIALIFIAIIIFCLCFFLKNEKNGNLRKPFCYTIAALLILQEFGYTLWHVSINDFHFGLHLPLHLCGASVLLSAFLLITRNQTIYEITYFWGLGGATQALLTPELGIFDFPHYRFFQLFTSHGLIILAVFYMIFVEKYRPEFKSVWKVFLITNFYLVFIIVVNLLTNGNYLFICHKPETASLMSYLGPWPWYILSLEGVALLSFLILYLPYAVKDKLIGNQTNSDII